MRRAHLLLATAMLLSLADMAAAAAPYSGTLPVMYIDTEDSAPVVSKDYYLNATYYIDPLGLPGVEPLGSEQAPLKMQIKGRGNWSWAGFEKKPYRLKFDKKASPLGLDSSKHFALLAHADDCYGFLRNPMGFWLSNALGMPWTPAEAPVEVMLNGEYIGLYFLTETIRVDKTRVNIDPQPDLATDPEVITGGWLVEIDNYRDDPHILIREGDGSDLVITYKDPEELSAEQEAYLTEQMQRINADVYSGDTDVCGWAGLVDLPTLAKFYVVQEVMDNYESFHGSCYINKQRGQDQKWMFGPVWDFGSAFNYDKTQYVYQGREHHQTWIGQMCRFPAFMAQVKAVWEGFYPLRYQEMLDYAHDYAERIAAAAACDARRWPQYGNADEMAKAALVETRLRRSCAWLAAQWGVPVVDPDLQPVTVYYLNDAPWGEWSQVYAYSWDESPEGFQQIFGDWPGRQMQPVTLDGRRVWAITTIPEHPLGQNPGLIFNNGGSGGANQTADLRLMPGHIYSYDGSSESGVEDVSVDNASPTPVYDLLGRRLQHPAPGVRIRDGHIIILKK